jgi:hypothetical protein
MDLRRNPYAPGAGTPPPEVAGRDRIIERAAHDALSLNKLALHAAVGLNVKHLARTQQWINDHDADLGIHL